MSNNKIPNWRSDFPIRDKEAVHVSRREFAKFLSLFSGALALGSGAIVVKTLAFPGEEPEGEHFICERNRRYVRQHVSVRNGRQQNNSLSVDYLPTAIWALLSKNVRICRARYIMLPKTTGSSARAIKDFSIRGRETSLRALRPGRYLNWKWYGKTEKFSSGHLKTVN